MPSRLQIAISNEFLAGNVWREKEIHRKKKLLDPGFFPWTSFSPQTLYYSQLTSVYLQRALTVYRRRDIPRTGCPRRSAGSHDSTQPHRTATLCGYAATHTSHYSTRFQPSCLALVAFLTEDKGRTLSEGLS